ncbi:MAG: hypothetical protein IMX02_06825 [Limnochordaceae bacterium]|nr:hypothetical protein [Limnochordaceae bacterium]
MVQRWQGVRHGVCDVVWWVWCYLPASSLRIQRIHRHHVAEVTMAL